MQLAKPTALLLLLATALGAVSCSSEGGASRTSGGASSVANPQGRGDATVSPPPRVCRTDPNLRCVTLTTGAAAIVYPVQKGRTSLGNLLWDPGGPGMDPLDYGATRAALPRWTQKFQLVSLAERQGITQQLSQCLEEAGLRTSTAAAGPAELDNCDWAAWRNTPSFVRDSLEDLQTKIGPTIGVYASSFGATRSAEAIRAVVKSGGFAVVDAPAPGPNTTGARILRDRWNRGWRVATATPACSASCVQVRNQKLKAFLSQSQQMERDDAELGLLSLTTHVGENEEFFKSVWRALPTLSRTQVLVWRRSARSFDLASSNAATQSQLVRYLSGMCAAYQGWPLRATNALEEMHLPCRSGALAGADITTSEPIEGRVLVLVNDIDSAVSKRLQESWATDLRGAKVAHYMAPGHTAAPELVDVMVGKWVTKQVRDAR